MHFYRTYLQQPHPVLIALIFIVAILLLWQARTLWDFSALQTAQAEPVAQGIVEEVLAEQETESAPHGRAVVEQRLRVRLESGDRVNVINDFTPVETGDEVFLRGPFPDEADEEIYTVREVRRDIGLYVLAALFAAVVILVAGTKGVRALVGLVFSLAIIVSFIIPFILRGFDPIFISIAGAGGIVLATLYISYGISRKSLVALAGIMGTLAIVAVAAKISVASLNFTGLAQEESLFLLYQTEAVRNFLGLVIAGIIIAGLGVLDDVAVTQAATVEELHKTDPALTTRQLFAKSMNIGRDHISAVINTLVLAYAGAALPLVLFLSFNQFPFHFVLSSEFIAEEVVRTLVSSLGLVLAVPVTTLLAAVVFSRKTR